jgi:Uma2 family endonuclease
MQSGQRAMSVARESILTLLEETDGRSELYDGELREKPPMSVDHNQSVWELLRQLLPQLPPSIYQLRSNGGHLAVPGANSFVPDLFVLPVETLARMTPEQRRFERYADPMPFVVEIWSPSTGTYDVDRKIPGYQARGDLEIWRIHPFDQVILIWRRQDDGRYVESEARGGTIALHAVPDETIGLDALWA